MTEIPRWSGCPTFNAVYAYAPDAGLADFRVIRVSTAETEPVIGSFLEAPMPVLRALPFDLTWLEIVGTHRLGAVVLEATGDEWTASVLANPRARAYSTPDLACIRGVFGVEEFTAYPAHDAQTEGDVEHLAMFAMAQVFAMSALLSSSNVALREAVEPTRQARRAAQRSGAQQPQVIYVRQGKRKGSKGTGGARDLTHRYDVRGHFQHHGRGPIFENCKDETKRIIHQGEEVVRVWCPPHVVGPEHLPYVPKVRAIASRSD